MPYAYFQCLFAEYIDVNQHMQRPPFVVRSSVDFEDGRCHRHMCRAEPGGCRS